MATLYDSKPYENGKIKPSTTQALENMAEENEKKTKGRSEKDSTGSSRI